MGVGMIEDATGIFPYAVADSVLEEIERHTGLSIVLRPLLVELLSDKADEIYGESESFRRRLRGDKGRDVLWAFMRHWAAAELKTWQPPVYKKLPSDFKVGRSLEVSR